MRKLLIATATAIALGAAMTPGALAFGLGGNGVHSGIGGGHFSVPGRRFGGPYAGGFGGAHLGGPHSGFGSYRGFPGYFGYGGYGLGLGGRGLGDYRG